MWYTCRAAGFLWILYTVVFQTLMHIWKYVYGPLAVRPANIWDGSTPYVSAPKLPAPDRPLLLPSERPFHPCLLVTLEIVCSLLSLQALCSLSSADSHSHPYQIGYEQDAVSFASPVLCFPTKSPLFISILQIKSGKQEWQK